MKSHRFARFAIVLLIAAFCLLPAVAMADENAAAGDDAAVYSGMVNQAIVYLRSEGQSQDGSFSAQTGPAVTALVLTGVLRNGRTVEDPLVAEGLAFLKGFVQPDGGIYQEGGTHRNYETCIAVTCFAAANDDGRYDKLLADADRFLKGLQWDQGEGIEPSHENYGGAGYGGKRRPDLSNTSFLIDALKSAGNGADDPAIQRALVFVSRCQNLESEYNTTPFGAKNPDGGFYYTPAAGGASMAGTTPQGGLRSYGSMTYAGLKSMIYAGLGPDDPRVKAAVDWIQANYDLTSNPHLGSAGLYYYYNTFAKALDAMDLDQVKDADGRAHDWRRELIEELARRQQPNGCWINENSRWLEGDPNLVTGYVLLTLSHCRATETSP